MSKLIFKIGEESIPTVLDNDSYSTSPFASQLKAGHKRLVELLQSWKYSLIPNSINRCADDANQSELIFSEQPVVNNIIAFLGERGSGKTSCLHSLKQIFPKHADSRQLADDTIFMPIIDPSFFDEHHNILEIFIGELYHDYEKMVKPWEQMSNAERQKIRNLHGWFAKVRQSIKFVSAQKLEIPDEEEGLSALSEGVNLRILVSNLVNAYLVCKRKKYLVISIDDIDLNIRQAYGMMEKIRKYLVVPNVVILMAAKFSQLRNSIVLNMTDYYTKILNSVIDIHTIQTMADRYLDKFIPLERRIYMPNFTDYSAAKLDIIDKGETTASTDNQFESVEFAVLSLIYRKCGYLFYNYEETPSLIIPENLRELRSFVTMLYEMDDRKDKDTNETNKDAHERNKNAFKEYFHTQWMQRLPSDQQRIAADILREKDLTKINKTVVTLLHGYAGNMRKGPVSSKSENPATNNTVNEKPGRVRLLEIEDPANYSENISIGDVMAMLDDLSSVAGSSHINLLIFFVRTFYSMLLYQLYDDMTEDVDRNVAAANDSNMSETGENANPTGFPKLRSKKDYGVPNYFKAVGNSFFTLTGETFLPIESTRGYSRELTLMNANLLFQEIASVIEEDRKLKKQPRSKEFVLHLNLVEFFMLCASRQIESKDGTFSPFRRSNWRAESSDFYFHPFDRGTKSILFDVTAPFVNMLNPKAAYRRFGNQILDVALKCEDSIIKSLLKDRRYDTPSFPTVSEGHDLLSRAAIRNIEVLNDLSLWMIKNKESFEDGKNRDLPILRDFYHKLNGNGSEDSGYRVKTYEQNRGTGDYHTIDFSPFRILVNFLNSLTPARNGNKDAKLEETRKRMLDLFLRIYRKENVLAVDTLYSLPELIRILRDSNEYDIPEKDNTITEIMTSTGEEIRSNLLVEYLADIPRVKKGLFSSYFDNALYALYKRLVEVNMDKYRDSLRHDVASLGRRRSLALKDFEHTEEERKQVESKIAAVRKRINNQTDNLTSSEKEMQKSVMEINRFSEEINVSKAQMRKLEDEKRKLQSAIDEQTKRLEQLKKDLEQKGFLQVMLPQPHPDKENIGNEIKELELKIKESGKLLQEYSDAMGSIAREMKEEADRISDFEQRKEIADIQLLDLQKSIQGLKSQIEQDNDLFENLRHDAGFLKQRSIDIKTNVDRIEDNLNFLQIEYDDFKKLHDTTLKALKKNSR